MPYDPALTTDRDKARSLLWDTNDAAPLRPDATYDALLAEKGFAYTIAFLAQTFRSEDARKVDSFSSAGSIAVTWRARDAAWKDLLATWGWALEQHVASAGVVLMGSVVYANDPYAVDDTVEDQQ